MLACEKRDVIATIVRVGEAFTKERKSSAAWREGLELMVRWIRDRWMVSRGTADGAKGGRCSSVVRNFRGGTIGIGPRGLQACVGYRREAMGGGRNGAARLTRSGTRALIG
jgi:hypothetical protein